MLDGFSWLIVAIFLSPFLILISRIESLSNPFRGDFFRVLAQTAEQAALSSLISIILGIAGALGLLAVHHSRWRRGVEIFVLLPGLLPALFVIMATLNLVSAVMNFPFGIWGVVIVHVFMSVGAVSVVIARKIESQSGGAIELATVEGAGRTQLLWATLGEMKFSLLVTGFFVFALAFAAFSVPLIVGADRGETLEVLIYRAVLGRGDLGYGLGLAFIQLSILAFFSYLVGWMGSVVAI